MGYQPLLISNFKTGLQDNQQPWLIMDDAQSMIFDGYVRNGVIRKRDGYNGYANGQRGSAPYCESRIVRETSENLTGTVDSANKDFTATLTTPVRRGGITVTDSSVGQTLTDDGVGALSGDGTGTINYSTGALAVSFTAAPTGGTPSVAYQYHPGNPVMMIAQFTANDNDKEMIVCDTDFVNKYNEVTNRLDDITNRTYTGASNNFFDWVQYPDITDSARLLFVNNVDPIQRYNGTSVSDFLAAFETGTAFTTEAFDTGDGTTGPYSNTVSNPPIIPGTITIDEAGGQAVTDDGSGGLTGDGTGTVNYYTGEVTVTFTGVVASMAAITIDYTQADGYVQTCLHVINFRDRLILLRTTESGTVYPQRIRISGTGQSGDDFRPDVATGSGVIDIPDSEWISGWEFSRDDLLIFTNRSTWILKYTGNDIVPFSLSRIDETRGNLAPFAPISYLGYAKAFSPRGFTITDGYQIQRYDDKIPDYSFQEIDQENFDLCFSGDIDDEDNHWLIHASPDTSQSDRVLVHNYEEGNFSVYRLSLSCMGKYIETADTITWTDLLTLYPDATDPDTDVWNGQFSQDYATWNDFNFGKDQFISIGGGHSGEIWRLNKNEGEDNPQRIRNITTVSTNPLVLQITTDWNNYALGDYIYFGGVEGADEVNGKQGFVIDVTDNYIFNVQFASSDIESISSYTADTGSASRCIPFEIVTKNFNPYVETGTKLRCGYFYIRANTTETLLTDPDDNVVSAVLEIEMLANDNAEYPVQIRSTDLNLSGRLTNRSGAVGVKRWNKSFPNLTGDFVQFKLTNTQAGTRIAIDAFLLGMRPVGRIL